MYLEAQRGQRDFRPNREDIVEAIDWLGKRIFHKENVSVRPATIDNKLGTKQLKQHELVPMSVVLRRESYPEFYLPPRPDFAPEQLAERARTVQIRELDPDAETDSLDSQLAKLYLKLVRDPRNAPHFTDVYKSREEGIKPITPEGFRRWMKERGKHILVGLNRFGEPVGFGAVQDAAPSQHDHFIERLVVLPDFQRKILTQEERLRQILRAKRKARMGEAIAKQEGAGSVLVDQIVEWAFHADDILGRKRDKIDAAIVMDVPGWERVRDLFWIKMGFRVVSALPRQADIFYRDEVDMISDFIRLHTMRFEIDRDSWEARKHVQEEKKQSGL